MDQWAWRLYAREAVIIAVFYGVAAWYDAPSIVVGEAVLRGVMLGLVLGALSVHRLNVVRRTDAELIGADPDTWRVVHESLRTGEPPENPEYDTALARLVAVRRSDRSTSWGGSEWLTLPAAAGLGAWVTNAPHWIGLGVVLATLAAVAIWRWRRERRLLDRLSFALIQRSRPPVGN